MAYKVGDRVRRIGESHSGVEKGRVYTVNKVEGMWIGFSEVGEKANFLPKNFELVEEPKKTLTVDSAAWAEMVETVAFSYSGGRIEPIPWYDLYYNPGITTNKPTNIMDTVSRIAKKLLDKDTKTLIKAGYLDSCLNLTSAGKENLTLIAFEAHKKALVEAAEEEIAEREEKN